MLLMNIGAEVEQFNPEAHENLEDVMEIEESDDPDDHDEIKGKVHKKGKGKGKGKGKRKKR